MLEESKDQHPARQRSGHGPEITPTPQPAGTAAGSLWLESVRFLPLLRKKHDLSAVRTSRQVSQRLKTLLIWQRVLGKGAQHVCVGMVAGMEKFAHGVRFREPA
jgi:hypothetical protein